MTRKSGSLEGWARTRFKLRLKSTKNLCLRHRFFDETRQNPPILLCFQAKVTDSLQKSGALAGQDRKLSRQSRLGEKIGLLAVAVIAQSV